MRLQIINCGSKCKWCDGYGIMLLYGGTGRPEIEAPCLECSPTKNIYDLYRERNRAIRAYLKSEELKAIEDHNKRICELEG